MKYDLRFKPRSLKDLKKLPANQQERVIERIDGIARGELRVKPGVVELERQVGYRQWAPPCLELEP